MPITRRGRGGGRGNGRSKRNGEHATGLENVESLRSSSIQDGTASTAQSSRSESLPDNNIIVVNQPSPSDQSLADLSTRKRNRDAIEAAEALARIQDEEDQLDTNRKIMELEMEAKKRRLDREKSLIAEKLRIFSTLNLSIINENSQNVPSINNLSTDNNTDNILNQDILLNSESNNSNNPDLTVCQLTNATNALTQAINMCTGTNFQAHDNDMKKLVARQSTSKDLISFSGDPGDWPMFIADYRDSTHRCGYSNSENMDRLRKCLRGKARDAVQSMLVLPMNLDRVIQTLEVNFGRPDLIITTMIAKAKQIQSPSDNNPESIINFSNAVLNMVATMESLNKPSHLMNPQLLSELVEKLPIMSRIKWARKSSKFGGEFGLAEFASWLSDYAKLMSHIQKFKAPEARMSSNYPSTSNNKSYYQNKYRNDSRSDRNFRENVMTVNETSRDAQKKKKCSFCQRGPHDLEHCRDFLVETVKDRWNFARQNRICFCCLGSGHQLRQCTRKNEKDKKVCGVGGCQRSHHPLLHGLEEDQGQKKNEELILHTVQAQNNNRAVLLKIIPITVSGPLGEISTYALLDGGSTVTLMDAVVADRIGLDGPSRKLYLRWTNESCRQEMESKTVSPIITGRNGASFQLNGVRTVCGFDLPLQSVNIENLKRRWQHLENYDVKEVDLREMEEAKPTLLIGQDHWELLETSEIIRGPSNAPALSLTPLGWVLHGVVPSRKSLQEEVTLYHWNDDKDEELHQLVKQSFSTEDFGVKVVQNLPRSDSRRFAD